MLVLAETTAFDTTQDETHVIFALFQAQDRIAALLTAAGAFMLALAGITSFATSRDVGIKLWGNLANIVTIAYYAVPGSTILTVIRSRSSASLSLPHNIMNTVSEKINLTMSTHVAEEWFSLLRSEVQSIMASEDAICMIIGRDRRPTVLNWPYALLTQANAALWAAYGLAIGDIYVWLPSVPGLMIAPVRWCKA